MQPPEGGAGILLAACALRRTRAADVIGDSLLGAKAVHSTKGVCGPQAPKIQSLLVQRKSKGASRRWKGRPGQGEGGGGRSSPPACWSRRRNRTAAGEVLSRFLSTWRRCDRGTSTGNKRRFPEGLREVLQA